LTSDRRRGANKTNAKASTGPTSKAGKSRSSRNAVRHGLNIPIWRDPILAPQAEALAQRIAGRDSSDERLDLARRVAGAQLDVVRTRARRKHLVERPLVDPQGIGHPHVNAEDNRHSPKPLESDEEISTIVLDRASEFARLDRYERRALSRRKSAIRQFDRQTEQERRSRKK
jgi:hypothetical protein